MVEWISVAERLPDREDYFLVWREKYEMDIARFDYYHSKRFLIADRNIDVDYDTYAEYWAELPEPPISK